MRGLLISIPFTRDGRRYNPAYAGTTQPAVCRACERLIQPRVCGDYRITSLKAERDADTTPRMRGLRVVSTSDRTTWRYNPAYAGTTAPAAANLERRQIQPRVCGDYSSASPLPMPSRDTTPRMRGLLYQVSIRPQYNRYNPAYAGTTGTCRRPWHCSTIQPRVCGDYRGAFL